MLSIRQNDNLFVTIVNDNTWESVYSSHVPATRGFHRLAIPAWSSTIAWQERPPETESIFNNHSLFIILQLIASLEKGIHGASKVFVE